MLCVMHKTRHLIYIGSVYPAENGYQLMLGVNLRWMVSHVGKMNDSHPPSTTDTVDNHQPNEPNEAEMLTNTWKRSMLPRTIPLLLVSPTALIAISL